MLLLAVDSSGRQGSIALAECGAGQSCAIIEIVALTGGTFSAELVLQIAALLEKHGHTKNDLDAFAVASGPGSFTGLRVGLAAIKALAEALQKPIAAISLLKAVASSTAAPGRVFALLDAGRGDVYAGDYEFDPQIQSHWRMRSERLLSGDAFLVEAKGANFRTVVTSDGAQAEAMHAAGIQVELIEQPNSGAIARLGWEHLQRAETVRPEDLEANYIRHSDAEIFAKPKA